MSPTEPQALSAMRQRLSRILSHINDHPYLSMHAEERKAPYLSVLRFLRTYSEDIPGFEDLPISQVLAVFKELEESIMRKGPE